MNYLFLLILPVFFHKTGPPPILNEGVVISYQLNAKHYITTDTRYTTRFKLFIEESRSVFMEDNLIKYFELHNSALSSEERARRRATFKTPEFKFLVEKQDTTFMFVEEHYLDRNLAYTAPKMNAEHWAVTSDTATIAGLMTYKASCQLGGRTWIAWFAPELPFSDGPYKFSGLPGLIVHLESEDGEYKFSLTGIEKMNDDLKTPKLPPYESVSLTKYGELKEYSLNNATAYFVDKGIEIKGLKWHGKEVTVDEYNQLVKKERLKKNPIEKLNSQ